MTEITLPEVSRRLTIIREAFGFRSSEIADLLGIERTYWTRFEKGHRLVPVEKAAIICARLGVTLDFIYLGKLEGVPLSTAERIRSVEGARA